jgi:general stress protein 26
MINQALIDFVKKNPVGIISTTGEHGLSGAAVYYMIDTDGSLYFNSHRDSEKVTNILSNPEVAFTAFQKDPAVTLQMKGKAERIGDVAHIEETYTALLHRVFEDGNIPPILRITGEGMVELIKVTPTWMRLGSFSGAAGSDLYTMIVGE